MLRLYPVFLFSLLLPAVFHAQNSNTTFRSKISFPGQTLANVWGYAAPDGREYVLAGGSKGLIVVDITNPDAPQQIVQIPGPNNLWKEIKTYQQYAYIVSEGGQGIQVVDLSALPSASLPSKFYQGDGPIAGQLTRIHALHIDTATGYLYAYGGNLFGGGAKIFDLHTDPWNPAYVGKFDQLGYIHDGYVDNDLMFSGHIYAGQFAVVDMRNKSNPVVLATQNTPGDFTHNTWLTDDRRVILTTDEVNNSVLAAYDVSDPTDIRLLDQVQSNPGSNSVVHNTHILGNYAVTSWYKDGFTIVDITRPDNLVQTGHYDTYPGYAGSGFEGCWGVYPYFPSGAIAATNISAPGTNNTGELYIITPEYTRACYLEGSVTDAVSGLPLSNAVVEIVGAPTPTLQSSGASGAYKMGQAASGYFTARVVKGGYQTLETPVLLENGQVTVLNAALFPNGNLTVSGVVLSAGKKQPYEFASVFLYGRNQVYNTVADAKGAFSISGVQPGIYDIAASALTGANVLMAHQVMVADTNLTVYLYPRLKPQARPGAEDERMRVFPNPSSAAFTVECRLLPEERGALRLTDALGRTLWTQQVDAGNPVVSIHEDLPPGAYWLWLETDAPAPPVRLFRQ